MGGSGKVGVRLVAASKNMFQVDWSSIYFMVFHRLWWIEWFGGSIAYHFSTRKRLIIVSQRRDRTTVAIFETFTLF